MAPKIGEEEGRFWDLLVKALGGLIAIGTVWMGLLTIQDQGKQLKLQQQQLSAQQSQLQEEYHRRFWEKKLEVYIQLCHVAGILALVEADSDEYKQARHQLMMIYSGELQVLASPEVKSAFREFLKALPDKGNISLVPKSTPTISGPVAIVNWAGLHRAVAELALACRQDAGIEFHLDVQQVQKYKADIDDFAQTWAKWLAK